MPLLSSTSMKEKREKEERPGIWHQWWRVVARVVTIALASGAVCLFVWNFLAFSSADSQHLSASLAASFVVWFLALALLNALVSLMIGTAIIWRLWGKENEWLGLLTAFFLILNGTLTNSGGIFLDFSPSAPLLLQIVGVIGFFLFWPTTGMVLLTFPTGRFAPRWTWLLILPWIAQEFLYDALANGPPLLFSGERLLVFGSCFAVLFYRSQRFYTPVQRQQVKWLLFGFAPSYLFYLLYGALQGLAALNSSTLLFLSIGRLVSFCATLWIPLAVGIALLRYRLWDIDVLINRTLVYGLLTLILALGYLGLVVGGQALLTGLIGNPGDLVIVGSTLIMALLFQPLRRGIQAMIDQRFYRQKYNAAQTLQGLGAILQREVELERLCEQIQIVVKETVQPVQISLWLNERRREAPSSPPATIKQEDGGNESS